MYVMCKYDDFRELQLTPHLKKVITNDVQFNPPLVEIRQHLRKCYCYRY